MIANMFTAAYALTDSTLFRWFAATAALVAVATWALRRLLRWANAGVERHVTAALEQEAADWNEPSRAQIEMTWDDLALGRVLAALDETDETWLFDAPEFAPPAAQRIREQIRANHDAEVERFRRELDGYGHGGAA